MSQPELSLGVTATGRPKGGYKNAAGKRVPGVTTILSRFKESGGLIQWAWTVGRDGLDLNDVRDRAADAGTCTHEQIDAWVHKREFDRSQWKPEILKKSDHCFLGFLQWTEQSKLSVEASEVSLVSEKYQYGGTFDAVRIGANQVLKLADWKTSSGIYTDMLVQVAGGYSLLWQEHFPDKEITGIEIIRVSKPDSEDDPVSFEHRSWSAEVIPIAQRYFIMLRQAYDLDKRIKGLL